MVAEYSWEALIESDKGLQRLFGDKRYRGEPLGIFACLPYYDEFVELIRFVEHSYLYKRGTEIQILREAKYFFDEDDFLRAMNNDLKNVNKTDDFIYISPQHNIIVIRDPIGLRGTTPWYC